MTNLNPLARLPQFGQSVYVDEIRRSWLHDGTLARYIERDAVRGVTSNPAIFQKSIAETDDYRDGIAALAAKGANVNELYEALVTEDIAGAADLFRPQWYASGGRFGWVSLEVSPELAHDAAATIQEAERLRERVARPNVFIKVPGTEAGTEAIRTLIYRGVPVNVTLLFGLDRYRAVHDAYLDALERRVQEGRSPDVASVASFFLSRIDVAVDPLLDEIAARGGAVAAQAARLKGRIAVDNAVAAYGDWSKVMESDRWRTLKDAGARPQRLLWASTGTKNEADPPLKYVEPLIGPETVTTLPVPTLDAYREQGEPAERIGDDRAGAEARLAELGALGISLDAVTARLESDGVRKFVDPFRSLMNTLKDAVRNASGS